jgi:tRNA nucleotidyltransferase/poly(A) polymerase
MRLITKFSEWLISESFQMSKTRRKMPIPVEVEQLAELFQKNGFRLLVVGGAVRDFHSGIDPKDYDLVSDALPDDIDKFLPATYQTLDVGRKFNISFVIAPDGNQYEIATFRKDIGKGRRPEGVEYATLDDDSKRRDLTINAIYYDIAADNFIDMEGGIGDIKTGSIKTVGDPTLRFDEDPLRRLRAIRFAAVIGGRVDKTIEKSLLTDNSLEGVSGNRIREELLAGLKKSKNSKYYLSELDRFKFLESIFPSLNVNKVFIDCKNPIVCIGILLSDNEYTDRIGLHLKNIGYERSEVADFVFIQSLIRFQHTQIVETVKKRNSSSLKLNDLLPVAQDLGIDSKVLRAIFDTQLSIKGNDPRLKGMHGRELGLGINQLEIENFLQKIA